MIRIGDMIITALIIGVPTILLFLSIPYILFLHCIALVDDNIAGYTIEPKGKRGKCEIHEHYLVWNRIHISKAFDEEDFRVYSLFVMKDKQKHMGKITEMNHENNTIKIQTICDKEILINMEDVFDMSI